MIESELLSIRIFLVKVTLKIGEEEFFFIDFVLKTNPWTHEAKVLSGEKIIGSFYEK